jgi:lysophospholipase L1-like esterase
MLAALAALVPAAALAQAPPAGAKYVAMGSSYAAGLGITTSADEPPNRCTRSRDNYPHQLARRHGLVLVDVSCSGATTEHILGPWRELAPQLDAVDADTRLVTVTIGGNDVRYTSGLSASACHVVGTGRCGDVPPATEADWVGLEQRMNRIAVAVRARAPSARLVFVDYPTLLPPNGACPALSLTPEEAESFRQVTRRVVEITARAARANHADLVQASALTAAHDACSAAPWANGYPSPGHPIVGAPFHPRLEAHSAIADALDKLIWGGSN